MAPETNGQTAQAQLKVEAQPLPQATQEESSAAETPAVRSDREAPDQGLTGLFGLLFYAVVGLVIWAFTPPVWQFGLIRVGFILVACLLPAAMYYLFIVTRKGSLLNEFVANMARLGLLGRQAVQGPDGDYNWESEVDRVRRVDAYP